MEYQLTESEKMAAEAYMNAIHDMATEFLIIFAKAISNSDPKAVKEYLDKLEILIEQGRCGNGSTWCPKKEMILAMYQRLLCNKQ